MASMKCICGNVMSNVDSPNDMELVVFTQREWEKITEEVQGGLDIFEVEPKNDIWKCDSCCRIYVFDRSKVILRYVVEEDNRQF